MGIEEIDEDADDIMPMDFGFTHQNFDYILFSIVDTCP